MINNYLDFRQAVLNLKQIEENIDSTISFFVKNEAYFKEIEDRDLELGNQLNQIAKKIFEIKGNSEGYIENEEIRKIAKKIRDYGMTRLTTELESGGIFREKKVPQVILDLILKELNEEELKNAHTISKEFKKILKKLNISTIINHQPEISIEKLFGTIENFKSFITEKGHELKCLNLQKIETNGSNFFENIPNKCSNLEIFYLNFSENKLLDCLSNLKYLKTLNLKVEIKHEDDIKNFETFIEEYKGHLIKEINLYDPKWLVESTTIEKISQYFPYLETFYLNIYDDKIFDYLETFNDLKTLNVNVSIESDPDREKLEEFIEKHGDLLKELNLYDPNCMVNNTTIAKISEYCPRLEIFVLENLTTRDEFFPVKKQLAGKALIHIGKLKNLKSLDFNLHRFKKCDIRNEYGKLKFIPIEQDLENCLKELPKLSTLRLGLHKSLLRPLKKSDNIVSSFLPEKKLKDFTAKYETLTCSYLYNQSNLESFCFWNCEDVIDREISYLANDLTKLNSLYFAESDISKQGLLDLTKISQLRVLHFDVLNKNTIIDSEVFASFSKLKYLERLVIRYSQIDVKGLIHLQKCENLKILDLTGCEIMNRDLKYLRKCKKLEILNLKECHSIRLREETAKFLLQKIKSLKKIIVDYGFYGTYEDTFQL